MGHDIGSYNKAGEQVGYIRFTMWDLNASLFYDLFDANEYNARVSGSGEVVTLSLPQIERALKNYEQLNDSDFSDRENEEFFR